ncbi:conserved protein of unknown function [Tenacibaculum sp. 190130A14a]|uniref:GLPGLI family protein n=1 Tax=Tenacibaculum polynesiense TaxID=3137857 RepID=A0ABM9P6X1_9FLAO
MKNILTLLLFIIVKTSFSQENFEGILKFKISITDNNGEMSEEESKQYIGNIQTFYLKGKKYKSEMNGLLNIVSYHEGKDTIFTKMNGVNALMFMKTNEEEEVVISHKLKKTDKTILGYKCELLEVKTNLGFHQYYFNRNLKVAPKNYENHKMGLWNFFTKITDGALSIISISETSKGKTYLELINIERKKLDDNIFKKPDNLPIIKTPDN